MVSMDSNYDSFSSCSPFLWTQYLKKETSSNLVQGCSRLTFIQSKWYVKNTIYYTTTANFDSVLALARFSFWWLNVKSQRSRSQS